MEVSPFVVRNQPDLKITAGYGHDHYGRGHWVVYFPLQHNDQDVLTTNPKGSGERQV